MGSILIFYKCKIINKAKVLTLDLKEKLFYIICVCFACVGVPYVKLQQW